MTTKLHIPLFDMTMCLSNAIDLVSPRVVDHHKRVAYIAGSIAKEIGFSEEDQENLILAGLLHDIGAISLKERFEALNFETDSPFQHTEVGYCMIKSFEGFSEIAPLVRHHHLQWNHGKGSMYKGHPLPLTCQVMYLADRISVLIDQEEEILGQVKRILEKIKGVSGEKFVPELVDAFMQLAEREYFWFDTVSSSMGKIIRGMTQLSSIQLNPQGLLNLTKLFSRIIDFRSEFTATHSSGVAIASSVLAKSAGMTENECDMMKIAGYLHDLGKLAVPTEILEKNGPLTKAESNIIKNHPYCTYRVLETVKSLHTINIWASLHHECLNGNGYPFHYRGKQLPLGSRIMAVADVFTALTEDRPYRPGMTKENTLKTIKKMTDNTSLDADIVSMLVHQYDEINDIRISAQSEETRDYREFCLKTR